MLFKGNKSKKLAFFAAMALVGGAFAPYTYAADVTINPSHPPVKNVPRPLTTGAAGGVGTDGADASGNTLTIQDYDYENNAVYGGAALGTGNAERNTLTIVNAKVLVGYGGAAQDGGNANHNKLVFHSGEIGTGMAGGLVNSETGSAEGNSVTVHSGTTSHIYGGYSKKAKARGNVHKNEVVVNGGTIDGKIKGGVIDEAKSMGNVTENTVTINGGTVKDAVYGGAIEKSNSIGTAAGNRVTINGGIVQKDIIGGFVRGKGTLTGNIVTIAGGEIAGEVYAAFSDNSRSVLTNNVVNLGDGKRALPVNISKFVWVARGRNGAASSGNTLNVKTRAEADYVSGFEKLNFYFNGALQPKLTLRKSMDLKIASLNDIGVYGSPQMKSGTLIEKERGKIKIKDGVTSATITGDTAEMTLRLDSTEKNLDYTRLIFKGATVAESEGTDTWGGRSRIGNTTTENEIAVDGGSHTNVYGGWTTGTGSTAAAERQGNSIRNHVTVRGTAAVSGTVYGGFTDAASGAATGNTVTIESAISGAVIGGQSAGDATGNKVFIHQNAGAVTGGISTGASASNNEVHLGGATISGDVVGGDGATTNANTVNLEGATVNGTITGGTAANGTGNVLNVKGTNTAANIAGFQTVTFDASNAAAGATMLHLNGAAATTLNKDAINATGSTVSGGVTLLYNANGINLTGYTGGVLRSVTDATTEQNIAVVRGLNNRITSLTYEGYRFAGVTTPINGGADVYGGISRAGNSTHDNAITVTGTHANVYGGYTGGAGTTAADQRNSYRNAVTVNGAAQISRTVYGGFTDVPGGAATGNTVTIDNARAGVVIGGKAGAEASGNTINLVNAAVGSVTGGDGARTNNNIINVTGSTVGGDVVGGHGTTTNSNVINLRNATVAGTVTGGTAANGTGNTLAVSYGTATTQIGDFDRIQKIHFDLEAAPTRGAHTLLKLTSVGGEKNLSGMNIGFHRDGASQKLEPGDKITLIENTDGGVVLGDNVTAQGTDGASREYTFDIVSEGNTLIATVAKTKISTQSKSFVETRTGASAFLNDGADFLAGTGTDAAQKEAAAAAATPGAVPFGLWAGVGGGALRHKTGSYVDMKGWNLGVGWARENAVKEGTLTFGPFIEYGRGSYDSYLDDGTHGSGKTSYVGVGVMAKLETKANNWIDGALRVGRTRSDYTGLASYDMTSTYYAMHVSVGKDFHVKSGDTVSAYVRYAYAHTAGTSAHLSSGETYDFDAVNSHRLRIGTRYTHGATALSRLYAGLAWEYEFDGDAHAASQGDSAPSPSLKGGSALLELGYRFAPKADSRVSYDLNLSGWQGKRQGITGGVAVKWAF